MVDYRLPQFRDDTWNRWKGGAKYTEDLLKKYTAPHVWTRLAKSNPFATNATVTPGCTGCDRRRQMLKRHLEQFQQRTGRQGKVLQNIIKRMEPPAAAPAPKNEGV